MKLLRSNIWMGILILMIFSSCRDNFIDTSVGDKMFDDPVVLVETSINGRIIGEDNAPLQDVLVDVEGETTFTDENGFFTVEGEFNKNGSYIKASKNGYFIGAKVVNPHVGTITFTQIKLLTMELTGTIQSSTGGSVTTSDNASVVFPANSIADQSGNAYNGPVDVFVKWIDPSSDQIDSEMPGDLRAINSDDEGVQLATYGMVAVELRGSAGQELNMADNTEAELTFPLPSEYQGIAPSSIPLWSFNEDTGYWEEEGTATLQDGSYVGQVSHFSFWNCDAPFPLVVVSGTVETENGTPAGFVQLEITVDGIGTRYGYTDSEGNFSGKMPKNQVLNIVAKDYCGEVLFEGNYGPYTEDTDIGTITIPAINTTTISGNLVNCAGSAVTNGYAFIEYDYFAYNMPIDDQGAFMSELFLCQSVDAIVKGYDLDEFKVSEPIEVTTTGTVDLGTIEVCDEITEFIKITVEDPADEIVLFEWLYGGFNPSGQYFIGSEGQDSTFVQLNLELDELQTGTVNIESIDFFSFELSNPNGSFFFCNSGCDGATADVTINEGTGGRVKGITELVTVSAQGGTDEVQITIEWDLTEN